MKLTKVFVIPSELSESRDLKNKNMDTIIVLLFLLLPTIFGLIGKKFEAAGEEGESEGGQPQSEPYDPMKKLAEMLGMDDPKPSVFSEDDEEDEDDEEPIDVAPAYDEPVYEEPVRPEPVYCEPVRPEPVYQEPVVEKPRKEEMSEVQQRARLAALRAQLAQQEEGKKKPKEVIDPKKLVIYSEIMKPKF